MIHRQASILGWFGFIWDKSLRIRAESSVGATDPKILNFGCIRNFCKKLFAIVCLSFENEPRIRKNPTLFMSENIVTIFLGQVLIPGVPWWRPNC